MVTCGQRSSLAICSSASSKRTLSPVKLAMLTANLSWKKEAACKWNRQSTVIYGFTDCRLSLISDGMDMLKDFLGREPSSDAFMREDIGINL